ncbi:TrbI/VirB10 family protein [Rugosibacter aromaticivorans]|uniref:TrbI/VirB10 family protein n=1 Tax=Rugosibacter aromaticivorans TaxID=1565605 RepID=UPI00192A32BB|nr:TrbI/VirB10 family protein [Rugosibacter aromaticivorans]
MKPPSNTNEPKTTNASANREQAIHDWEEQTDNAAHEGRKFSGERVKRIIKGDWLSKVGFVVVTLVILFFVLTHDSKQAKALRNEARAAELTDEPSVRDYRPPVMPARPVEPLQSANSNQQDKSSGKPTDDTEAIALRRKADQLDDARTKSDIIVKGGGSSINATATAAPSGVPASFNIPGLQLASGYGNRPDSSESNDPNRAFAQQMSGRTVVTATPRRVGNLDCLALQGKMIDAELETAINTDLPGQIRAVVSNPLYAEQGQEALVTPGSRLNGVYNTAVSKGQVRVFVIWNRLIRPDGVEITLDSGATDALGQAGLQGETDNHFAQIFGMSALLSIIGAGAGTSSVGSDSNYNSADAYRSAVQQSFARTSNSVLAPYANIPPTNTVHQGERIKVFLNRDLDFCRLRAETNDQADLVLP